MLTMSVITTTRSHRRVMFLLLLFMTTTALVWCVEGFQQQQHVGGRRSSSLPTTTTTSTYSLLHMTATDDAETSSSSTSSDEQKLSSESESLLLLDPKTISQKVFESDKRPVILFDGVCNMCNNAVNLALDWDPEGKLRFAALQSNVGRALLETNGRNADDISSIVLVSDSGAYIKSDAVLQIAAELNPLGPILPLRPIASLGIFVVPKFLRDLIYDGVADNRYSIMGKRNECRLDSDGEFEDRFVNDNIATKRA